VIPPIDLSHVTVGSRVRRLLAGTVPMDLWVIRSEPDRFHCAGILNEDAPEGTYWTFDRDSGAEIDDELGWGPEHGMTGSYISEVLPVDTWLPGVPT
jgi:hypothetical protein